MPLGRNSSSSASPRTPRRSSPRLATSLGFETAGGEDCFTTPQSMPRPSEPSTRGASTIRQRAVSGHRVSLNSPRSPRHPTYHLVPVDHDLDEDRVPFDSAYSRCTVGRVEPLWEYRDSESNWRVFTVSAERLEEAYLAGLPTLKLPQEGSKARNPPTVVYNLKEMTMEHPSAGTTTIRRREMEADYRQRPKSFTDFSTNFVKRHSPLLDRVHEGFFGGTAETMRIEGSEAKCAEVVSTGNVWTGERDGTLKIWNTRTGERVRTLEQKKDIFCHSLLEVPGRNGEPTVWAGYTDSVIRVFNANHPFEVLLQLKRHAQNAAVYCLAPQIGGHCVFSGGQDGRIYQWDIRTYECIGQFSGHSGAVRCIIADADTLYSGSDDGTIAVWDIYGRDRVEWRGHTGGVHHLVKTDQHIWSGSDDGSVRVWDTQTGECLRVIREPHSESINSMNLVGDKVWTSSNRTVYLWDATDITKDPVAQYANNHEGYVNNIVNIHKSLMCRVWTTGKEGVIKVWDAECSGTYNADEVLRPELAKRRAQVVYLKERLAELEKESAEKEAAHESRIGKLREDNNGLQDAYSAKVGELAIARRELAEARDRLQQLEALQKRHNDKTDELKKDLALERAKNSTFHEDHLRDIGMIRADADRRVDEGIRKIAELEAELAASRRELDGVSDLQRRLDEALDRASRQSDLTDELSRELDRKRAQLAELDGSLSRKDNDPMSTRAGFARKDGDLAMRDTEMAKLASELDHLKDMLAKQDCQPSDVHDEVLRLQGLLEEQRKMTDKHSDDLDASRGSKASDGATGDVASGVGKAESCFGGMESSMDASRGCGARVAQHNTPSADSKGWSPQNSPRASHGVSLGTECDGESSVGYTVTEDQESLSGGARRPHSYGIGRRAGSQGPTSPGQRPPWRSMSPGAVMMTPGGSFGNRSRSSSVQSPHAWQAADGYPQTPERQQPKDQVGLGTPDGVPCDVMEDGKVYYNGELLVGSDGEPVIYTAGNGRPTDGTGRRVLGVTEFGTLILLDSKGDPITLPVGLSGAPLSASSGRAVVEPLGGRPMLEDGTPVICGPDTRPIATTGGVVATLSKEGEVVGPDGKVVTGPDGTPLKIGKHGELLGGRAPVALMVRPDHTMEGVIPPGSPVFGDDCRPITGSTSSVAVQVGPDGHCIVGPDGRMVKGLDGYPVVVSPEGKPASSDGTPCQVVVTDDGRALVLEDLMAGEASMGQDAGRGRHGDGSAVGAGGYRGLGSYGMSGAPGDQENYGKATHANSYLDGTAYGKDGDNHLSGLVHGNDLLEGGCPNGTVHGKGGDSSLDNMGANAYRRHGKGGDCPLDEEGRYGNGKDGYSLDGEGHGHSNGMAYRSHGDGMGNLDGANGKGGDSSFDGMGLGRGGYRTGGEDGKSQLGGLGNYSHSGMQGTADGRSGETCHDGVHGTGSGAKAMLGNGDASAKMERLLDQLAQKETEAAGYMATIRDMNKLINKQDDELAQLRTMVASTDLPSPSPFSMQEMLYYYKHREEQFAKIGADNMALINENTALADHTQDLNQRIGTMAFILESRSSLLKVIYEMYKMCVHCNKTVEKFAKMVSVRERSRRELLDGIAGIKTEVVDVMNGEKWLIANMFTEDELLHLGTSPSFFVPDGKRFGKNRPAAFNKEVGTGTGRWIRTETAKVATPRSTQPPAPHEYKAGRMPTPRMTVTGMM